MAIQPQTPWPMARAGRAARPPVTHRRKLHLGHFAFMRGGGAGPGHAPRLGQLPALRGRALRHPQRPATDLEPALPTLEEFAAQRRMQKFFEAEQLQH